MSLALQYQEHTGRKIRMASPIDLASKKTFREEGVAKAPGVRRPRLIVLIVLEAG